MTNKERFLAGHTFMYKGIIYKLEKNILRRYEPYTFHWFATADTSLTEILSITIPVFGEMFTIDVLYEDLSFGK